MSEMEMLAKMDEEELYEWFCENARFMEHANGSGKYYIRVGTKIIKSDDTHDLFGGFYVMVKKFTQAE